MTKMQTSLSEYESIRPRSPGVPSGSSDVSMVDVRHTVEMQVIPRLHAALKSTIEKPRHPIIERKINTDGERAMQRALGRAIDQDASVAAFTDRLLADDHNGAESQIDAMRHDSQSLESIYLHLLAPAAYRIKLMWSEDVCGFAEATLALLTLQTLVRQYAPAFHAESGARETGLRALLVSPVTNGCDIGLPMFGLMLMSEFFRREGWEAWIERDLTGGKVRDTVLGEWFDLVEILATSENQLDEIAAGIRALRRRSINPRIGVMVCGQVFVDHPECVGLVGADFKADDPVSSLRQANAFLRSRAGFAAGLPPQENCQLLGNIVPTRLTRRDRLS